MSLPLLSGCVWVLLATVIATQPMRRQYLPGLVLLIAAPILLGWIASAHGFWIFGVGLFAFISMFRNPLRYLLRRARGESPKIPS